MEFISPWVIEEIRRRETEETKEIQQPLYIYDEPRQEVAVRPSENEAVERGVVIIPL